MPVQSGQLVCLTCGSRVALRSRRPPRWRVPVILALLVVALAVAGVFVALQTATGDGEDEVASGRASRQEPRPAGREHQAPQAPATTGTGETTQRQGETKPEPARSDDAELRAARRGPTAVLSGVAEPGAAAKFAKGLRRMGFRIGPVANAPAPAARSSVLYARGAKAAARTLAKEGGIRSVRPLDRATAQMARGARLVVIVGSKV